MATIAALQEGGVIAYPTEAMYGLGCDPNNSNAVERVIKLKNRDPAQGLILVAAAWQHVQHLTVIDESINYSTVFASWPGPNTWIFPASKLAPEFVTAKNSHTIAIRISAHPIIKSLCEKFGAAIVSTSANMHKQPAALNADDVVKIFGSSVDYIYKGNIGKHTSASCIRNANDERIIRQ